MLRKIILFLFIFAAFTPLFAQEKPISPAEAKAREDAFKANVVEYLKDTARETQNLASSGNRLLFASEVASLLWEFDEKEARVLFMAGMSDIRQQMAAFSSEVAEEPENSQDNPRGGLNIFGGGGGSQKFRRMMSSRRTVIDALSEFDPQTAFDFFLETKGIISNPKYAKQIDKMDTQLEAKLLPAISKNDPAKALEYGLQSLEKGINDSQIALIKDLYRKDASKAGKLASEMVKKLSEEKNIAGRNSITYQLLIIASNASQKRDALKLNKEPLLDESAKRELAEILAKGLLARSKPQDDDYRGSTYQVEEYIKAIEKYSPAKANQIRLKYKIKPAAKVNARLAPPVMMRPEGAALSTKNEVKIGDPNGSSDFETRLPEIIAKGKMSDGDKDKYMEAAREKILKAKRKEEKIMIIAGLAAPLLAAGQKELAKELLNEGKNLLNPQAKHYLDFSANLTMASAYAQVDPDRSFEIMENTIFQINDVIGGALKVVEFIDAQEELFAENELQLDLGFAGGLTRGASALLPFINVTLMKLAETDFPRTKALAEKFQRPEARFFARMIILRAIIKQKDNGGNPGGVFAEPDFDDDEGEDYEDGPIAPPLPPPRPARVPVPKPPMAGGLENQE